MKEIMQKYDEALDEYKIRDSFEDETLELILNFEKKKKLKKKFYAAKLSWAAAVFLLCIVVGSGGYAIAKGLNIDDILRERFSDKVTADKMKNKEYDELAVSGENGEIMAECIGTMGDERTYIMLLEVTIKKDKINGNENVGFGIKIYEKEDNPNDYSVAFCPAEKIVEDEDNIRYLVKYEMPLYFADYSSQENEEVIVDLCYFILDYGMNAETHTVHDMKIPVTLSKDSIQTAEKIEVNQSMMIKSREVSIKNVWLSEYKTEINIQFYAKDFYDADQFWKSITRDRIIDNNLEYKNNSVYLKLYHNGNLVDLAENYKEYTVNYSSDFSEETADEKNLAGDYINVLNLKAIDYKEGDTLELRYGDQVVRIK